MLYSCTHMATVGVKGLNPVSKSGYVLATVVADGRRFGTRSLYDGTAGHRLVSPPGESS